MPRLIQKATGQIPGTYFSSGTNTNSGGGGGGGGAVVSVGAAGATLAINNLVQTFADGNIYPVETSDYAASTPGQIIPITQLSGGSVSGGWINGNSYARGSDGSIYALSAGGASSNVVVSKYSPTGAPIRFLTLVSTGADGTDDVSSRMGSLFFLSNGSLVVVMDMADQGAGDTGDGVNVWIIDPSIMSVQNSYVIPNGYMGTAAVQEPAVADYGTVYLGPEVAALPLSSGNFVVASMERDAGTGHWYTIRTFSTTGAVLATSPQVNVFNGDLSSSIFLLELDNGDIAFFFLANSASSGFTPSFCIFDASLNQVVAPTILTGHGSATNVVSGEGVAMGTVISASAFNGTFAVTTNVHSTPNSDPPQVAVSVWLNAGTQVGTTIQLGATGNRPWMTNDGANYWHLNYTTTEINLSSLTTAGVLTQIASAVSQVIDNMSGFNYPWAPQYTFDKSLGCIFIFIPIGQNNNAFWAFKTTEQKFLVSSKPLGPATSVIPQSNFYHVLPLGDGTVLVHGINYTVNAQGIVQNLNGAFCAYKVLDSAILGVATDAATVNTSVTFDATAGYKTITPLLGSTNVSFDFTSTPILGNKGVINGTTVQLNGM